ncbi:MAG TPA: CRISPR-associated endoribonuclease Cas6 [Firmicutes bacterium]|nr:CRISPR-associated endoribonuclease Cas6 [Bacillota bacterium]
MHLQIYFRSQNGQLQLPIHYNHILQAALYNSISEELAAFLHNKGFVYEKRVFKMFSFSKLNGPYIFDKRNKRITFRDEISLTISSPLDEFYQSLANVLLSRGSMRLGYAEVQMEKVYAQKYHIQEDRIKVQALSPIVFYSTMIRPDGRKYTVYFQPGDPDYNDLLDKNLRKKFQSFYGKEPPDGKVSVVPLGNQRMHIVNYRNTIIKGYSGKLELSGPQPLLQLAVDAGLGGKNSQGFGCVRPV